MSLDTKSARVALLARKQELEDLSALSSDARGTVKLDQQSVGRLSRMDAMQSQAMAQATERQRMSELSRIEVALGRLDTGDYGICDECGEQVAPKRLEINPAAALCIKCANR